MSYASLRRVITERNAKTEINWRRGAARKPPRGDAAALLFLPVDKTAAMGIKYHVCEIDAHVYRAAAGRSHGSGVAFKTTLEKCTF